MELLTNPPVKLNTHKLVLIIILLMTLGQLAMVLYIPGLPGIAKALATRVSLMQMSITIYVIGFGCAGFIYGPMSDQYGRRPIILTGLTVFIFGTILALVANSIELLLIARLLQGIGMASGDTMGRAILCDSCSGGEFVRAASKISLASPATPLVAPVLGAYIQESMGWHANFGFMLIYGIACLLLVYYCLPETNPRLLAKLPRTPRFIKHTGTEYWTILKNPNFMGYFIPGVVAAMGELTYSMIAPFIMQKQHGWSAIQYGWFTIVISIGLLFGAMTAHRYSLRSPTYRMVLLGLAILFAGGIVMLISSYIPQFSIVGLALAMILYMMGTGIIFPNTNAGALTPFAHMAGSAGALQSGMQTALVGVLGMLVAEASIKTQNGLAQVILLVICTGTLFFWLLLRRATRTEATNS